MISLVIPCYNCASFIEEHLIRLAAFLTAHFSKFDIIAVNDGSIDNTLEVLHTCAAADTRIKVFSYAPNRGKGAAVKVGMLASRGEVAIFTDADLPYNLEAIPAFAKALEGGFDVALGARSDNGTVAGQRSHRTLLSKVFVSFANTVLLEHVLDTQAGFKGFTRAAAQDIFSVVSIPRFGFDAEVIMIAQKKRMKVAS